ncbi:hypothetical protein BDV59DRAFT_181642 [Aspergillus ambiguus]|uniref:uncharacterized protein n=1 Tax=Aspergillus ambiguus TaxID=176160 RepID=UPI003CCDBBA4
MSFFSHLCGCWSRPGTDNQDQPNSNQSPSQHNHTHNTNQNNPHDPVEADGYTPIIPLPAYTPRPRSIQEKTLEAHMRDPPISSDTATYRDEKAHFSLGDTHTPPSQRPEDLTSDVSSAISFPSSYGNTSTATRETPPPPYSPRAWSPVPSRRSMSISSGHVPMQPLSMAQIAQPPPVFQRRGTMSLVRGADGAAVRRSLDEQISPVAPLRRCSWESR